MVTQTLEGVEDCLLVNIYAPKSNPENKILNDRMTQLYELAHPDQAA
jgi:hypothetical protein